MKSLRSALVFAAFALTALAGAALLARTPARAADASKLRTAAPFLRTGDAVAIGQGVLAVSVKGEATSVTFSVAKLPAAVAAPLGVFLEDGVGAGTFTEVASIPALKKGGGNVVLASDSGPAAALGVADLAELVGRRVEVRLGDGTALLGATFPPLSKFSGIKLAAKIGPAPGSPLAKFSATVTCSPSPKTGSEKFLLKAKGLAPGAAYTLWMEDQPGSASYVLVGDLVGGQFLRDQARGDTLPLGAASLVDVVGRGVEVRDASGPVGRGAVPLILFGISWPQHHVFVIDEPATTLDRYLRFTGGGIVIYRSQVDLTQTSVGELIGEGESYWRLDPKGTADGGVVCTVRLQSNDRYWWIASDTAGPFGDTQHYLGVYNGSTPPNNLDDAKFIFRFLTDSKGKRTATIESVIYPGEFLVNDGHGLTANGIRFGTDRAPVSFSVR